MLLNRSTIANANATSHLFNKPMLALYMGVCCPSRKLPVDEKWVPVAKKGMSVVPWTIQNVPVTNV